MRYKRRPTAPLPNPATRLRTAASLGRTLSRQRPARRRPAADLALPPGPLSRGLAWLAGAGLRLGGLTLVLLGGWSLLVMSPAFAVRQVEVLGTRHLSRLDVLSAAGIGLHTSLLALVDRRAAGRVAALPWVAEASVERVWPRAVKITVRERVPRALALVGDTFYQLDGDLQAIAPVEGAAPPDRLVLSGLTPADLREPDDEITGLQAAARRFLARLAVKGPAGFGRVSEIHLDRVWGVSALWEDLPAVARLGFAEFDQRLTRLAAVAEDLRRRGEINRAVLIDLTLPDRVVVRLAGRAA
ncbi:MAG: FtsQ-type POTRA domain-containing protein [Deltaproteobacteria bacterium]|nr:FtsQ-type POTRA domain-containing protein [Deltaproteobacteria bacterium]